MPISFEFQNSGEIFNRVQLFSIIVSIKVNNKISSYNVKK